MESNEENESTEEENQGAEEEVKLLPWVSLPSKRMEAEKDEGLTYLESFRKFFIYKNIQIFDKLFDSPKMTTNCMTIRNNYFQQIYFVGTAGDRRPGKILPFTLRIVDQYNKLVIEIKKYLKPCFSKQTIDIECPPGKLLAQMVLCKEKREGKLFDIYPSDSSTQHLIITRKGNKSKNQFRIWSKDHDKIGSINKRYEKVLATDKTVVHEDHFTKITIADGRVPLSLSDKAIILSATLIVDIFLIKRL